MDGFRAFKYYTALKLHFTTPKFDVFVNKGHVKGSLQRYQMRNDRGLFEKLARQFPTDREFIQFVASNFMYGHPTMVYDMEEGLANYKVFQSRRQAMTRVFENDLDVILQSGAQYEIVDDKIPDVLQLLLAGKVTIETLVILNDLDGIIDRVADNSHLALLFGDQFLRINKSKGFVKYDSYKIMDQYLSFLEEVKGTVHG